MREATNASYVAEKEAEHAKIEHLVDEAFADGSARVAVRAYILRWRFVRTYMRPEFSRDPVRSDLSDYGYG